MYKRQPPPSASNAATAAVSAALDEAYTRGMADGRVAQRDDDLVALSEALQHLAEELAAHEIRRAELRHEAVVALSPLLSAIVDAVAPSGVAQRLERDLLAELERLAGQVPPTTCRIACPPALRDLVERCVDQAGLTAVEIVEQPLGDSLQLSLQGGHIEFSQERLTRSLRQLIAEIQED